MQTPGSACREEEIQAAGVFSGKKAAVVPASSGKSDDIRDGLEYTILDSYSTVLGIRLLVGEASSFRGSVGNGTNAGTFFFQKKNELSSPESSLALDKVDFPWLTYRRQQS